MVRQRIVNSLRDLAVSFGQSADGTQWHFFGSVNRDETRAEDIDLMILCKSDDQADIHRRIIDTDALELPLHLALLTFEEAIEAYVARVQQSHRYSLE